MLPNKLDDKIVAELEQLISDIKAGNRPTNPELEATVRQALAQVAKQHQ